MDYYCYTYISTDKSPGKIIRKNHIRVGITDLVMLRGYGVFDFIRTHCGKPFRLNDYINRFESSVKKMQLKTPISRKEIVRIIQLLLKKNKASSNKDFGIRLLLTGGYSLDSYLPAVQSNLFILIEDLPNYPQWYSEKGIKLITHEFIRESAEVKTVNYLTAIKQASERRKKNAQDTLYVHGGKILETTRNNFFMVKGNTLITSDADVLRGIIRKVIIELARHKYKVEIRPLLVNEIRNGSECFVTGTTRGITPVVKIDNRKIGNGRVGERTKILMSILSELIAKECGKC